MKIDDSKFLSALRLEPKTDEQGRLSFISQDTAGEAEKELDTFINKLKSFLKSWPWVYNFLQALGTPAFSTISGVSNKSVLRQAFGEDLGDKIVVNLGSGTKRLHPEVMNLDIFPFKNVDLVADIKNLPFKTDSVDMVICDSVLEHVGGAHEAIAEITRAVRSGGYVYVTVPFVYPFHASPNDYYRWTKEGLKNDFKDFSVVRIGMRGGPMGALQGVLIHIFSLLLSFRIAKLYSLLTQVFMFLLAPLKLLDFIFILFEQSHEIGAHIYFLGKKDVE